MLKSFALKQNVEIYPLFIVDQIEDAESEFVHRDGVVLGDLASMTGGRMSNAPNAARGCRSSNCRDCARPEDAVPGRFQVQRGLEHDGKRRGVKVKVSSPEGAPKLSVWTKAGYYARKD